MNSPFYAVQRSVLVRAELKHSRLPFVKSDWGREGFSAMPNSVDIDQTLSRAIIREIGERLHLLLKEEPEIPESLRAQIDRLRKLERLPRS